MSVSKPIQRAAINLTASYLQALYLRPVQTKCLTSYFIATLGNYVSQKIAGCKKINNNSLHAFGLFGLIFGGTLPHYFYQILEYIIPSSSAGANLKKFLIERFLYAPFYQFFSLYMLAIFEGKDHNQSMEQVRKLFWTVLQANWRWLSLIQFINLSLVPPMLRVLVVNLVGFFWSIFLANKRRIAEEKKS